jgi:hypothetical protein
MLKKLFFVAIVLAIAAGALEAFDVPVIGLFQPSIIRSTGGVHFRLP